MRRIGIFGGTFNPVHNGHVSFAKQIKEICQLDEVWILPANRPPHKQVARLASNEARFAMCKLAFEGLEDFRVSSLEFEMGGMSYTVHTLRELKKQHPQDRFFLLIGSDMIYTFDLWRDYCEIMKMAVVLAGARDREAYRSMLDKAAELSRAGGRVEVIPIQIMPLSSTQIRTRLAQGLDCSFAVPRSVLSYIQKNRLYDNHDGQALLEEIKPIVRKMLTEERYRHTEEVAKKAAYLAQKYGADPKDAQLAGYLHDIMKNQSHNYFLKYFHSNGIILTNIEKKTPALWHAIAGAVYSKRELGIEDTRVIRAVRYHTTAREHMDILEKIIYLADCISDDRKYDGVEELRDCADLDLNKALFCSLRGTILRLAYNSQPIHPDSLSAYNTLIDYKPEANE